MEEQNIIITDQVKELPVVALRGKVFFPNTYLNFDVGRQISKNAISKASQTDSLIFIATQKNAFTEEPTTDDVSKVGVVARIKQIIKLPNNNMKVGVEALYRAKIAEFTGNKDYFSAVVIRADYIPCQDPVVAEAYLRVAKKAFVEFALQDKRIPKEMLSTVSEKNDPNEFVDNALSIVIGLRESVAQELLDQDDTILRLERFEKLILHEMEILKIEKKISGKVRQSIDKSQKEANRN